MISRYRKIFLRVGETEDEWATAWQTYTVRPSKYRMYWKVMSKCTCSTTVSMLTRNENMEINFKGDCYQWDRPRGTSTRQVTQQQGHEPLLCLHSGMRGMNTTWWTLQTLVKWYVKWSIAAMSPWKWSCQPSLSLSLLQSNPMWQIHWLLARGTIQIFSIIVTTGIEHDQKIEHNKAFHGCSTLSSRHIPS